MAHVTQVHERDVRPGEQFADDGHGVLAVVYHDAAGDLTVPVVSANDLQAVAQAGRVLAWSEVAGARLCVDEYRAAFGIGTTGAGWCLGDEQHPFAGVRFPQAASQRTAALGINPHG